MSLQQIGHYRILHKLGRGGMATVYQAQDLRLNRYVALKILDREFTSDPDRLARFVQEAQIASIINHPNVLTVHDLGHDDGQHFIVTEMIEGRTLRERIDEGPLAALDAIRIACAIADALDAAHQYWVVHRDIKPENVMIRDDGLVKVLDFGLAKFTDPAAAGSGGIPVHTKPGLVPGSLRYVAPERLRGEGADPRTDIFSLGTVLYEMLAGVPAFEGPTIGIVLQRIALNEVEALETLKPGLPLDIVAIVRRAMDPDSRCRYQNAAEVARDLRRVHVPGAWERPTDEPWKQNGAAPGPPLVG